MLRILRRHLCERAPCRSFVASSCRGSDRDLTCEPQLHPSYSLPSSSDNVLGGDKPESRSIMPAWLTDRKSLGFRTSNIKLNGMEMAIWGRAFSSTKNTQDEVSDGTKRPIASTKKTLEDFQHEEVVGPTVERDMSPVADELRLAQMEMRGVMQKFSQALLAVGVAQLIWGGMMFRLLESPISHALMTQVCATSIILFGLGFYSKQSVKNIEFFTRLEERSRLQILTLSLQVTKTLSSFFQRGYGIGLVLLLVLTGNLIGCLMFLYEAYAGVRLHDVKRLNLLSSWQNLKCRPAQIFGDARSSCG